MLKQITVFLENKPGRLEEVTKCLADEAINVYALSLADTADFGILRLIVSDPEKTQMILKEKNFMAKIADVIAVAMDNNPGSLYKILKELKHLDASIEYMYAFSSWHKDYSAIVVLRLDNQDALIDKLKDNNLVLLGSDILDGCGK